MPKKFIIRLLTFSAILSVLSFLIYSFLLPQFYLSLFPLLILFFLIITIAVHLVLMKAVKKNPRQFSTFFMGSITAKLFIYMIFVVVMALSMPEIKVNFLITFFVLYVLYTFFETTSLLKDLKTEKNEKA